MEDNASKNWIIALGLVAFLFFILWTITLNIQTMLILKAIEGLL